MINIKNLLVILALIFSTLNAQFLDSFDDDDLNGWFYFSGDGEVKMSVIPNNGYARIYLDATDDKYNVWWAALKRDVTEFISVEKLENPQFELRVEARIKISSAPKRVNFMINTQRTKDYHLQLMEYDIPDTNNWHTISMTTNNFDAVKGDTVYVQFDITDWGMGKYVVDLDYYSAKIVDINNIKSDQGEAVPYHPPIPKIDNFSNHLIVTHDAIINSDFPDVNFNNWRTDNDQVNILTLSSNQYIILRWDLDEYQNHIIEDSGILELTTHSVQAGGNYKETYGNDLGMEFGKIRVIEILDGDPKWDKTKVTFNKFKCERKFEDVINSQMIYDAKISYKNKSKNYITISKPVLERLISGKTKGLLIKPLGAIIASFYSSNNNSTENIIKLHFNTLTK